MYLNDKLPATETKADPFSLPALVAWLRTKPADGEYCYMNTGTCLIGQYLKHIGIKRPSVGSTVWGRTPTEDIPMPMGWNAVAANFPRTFGAALKRAEALL